MKAFKWFAHPFKKNLHPFNAVTKTFKRFLNPLQKKLFPFDVPRKTFNCLFIILLRAVRSINLTFARYSPVLEMQNDRTLFWLYLFRDHRKRVIVASLDKRVKLKYPFAPK